MITREEALQTIHDCLHCDHSRIKFDDRKTLVCVKKNAEKVEFKDTCKLFKKHGKNKPMRFTKQKSTIAWQKKAIKELNNDNT